jgi:hypothetical protein
MHPTGRDLWVMVVSSSPFQHMKGKPDVKYVANIHGNEAVSREMALHLIQVKTFLDFSFSKTPKIIELFFSQNKQTAFSQELQGRRLHPLAAGPDANPHLAKSQSRRIRSGPRGHLHRWSRKVTPTHTHTSSIIFITTIHPSFTDARLVVVKVVFFSFSFPP